MVNQFNLHNYPWTEKVLIKYLIFSNQVEKEFQCKQLIYHQKWTTSWSCPTKLNILWEYTSFYSGIIWQYKNHQSVINVTFKETENGLMLLLLGYQE